MNNQNKIPEELLKTLPLNPNDLGNNFKIWLIDALTWLEEQGYFIEVSGNWVFTIYDKVNNDILTCFPSKYNSRIEAYTEGIRHCLNLMKNETNRS
jgi:hypothetical protein